MIHYFAYGSNLHPLRLQQRVSSAELVAVVKHRHHCLSFHKKSIDGSSKCNIVNTNLESDFVYGAIYQFKPEHKQHLDRFESLGSGYIDKQICVQHEEKQYTCFSYFAQQHYIVNNLKPYHWYKQLVVLGARYLQFPDAYIDTLEAIESIADQNKTRRKEHEALIESIIKYR